jgi:hypothetical protein
MKAGDELLSTVFNKDHRYVIPIFQRPYVWEEEENWVPLWHDLRKAAEDVEKESLTDDEGAEDAPEYFLGALVTQHRPPVPRRKPTSVVIDGQQRMTTLQVFLAAAWRVAHTLGASQAADDFEALVRNRVSADSEHPEDRYKIAPLPHDREAFEWAVRAPGSADQRPSADHRLALAADWFEQTLRDWVQESDELVARLDLLHFAVTNRIKVVSVFLDGKDDPQVIFEALNHLGVRLDAADLVKNLLFQTLNRQGKRALEVELLQEHWAVLDAGRWRQEITTGRIKRVRVDILLAYWLAVQRGEESSVEHLFEDFKRWMRATAADAESVIRSIRVYADTMERLQQLPMTSPVAQAIDRLEATNTTTPWPLLLFLHAEPQVPTEQAELGVAAIDSFLMRRAICRLTTKDYNRLFGTVLAEIRNGNLSRAGETIWESLASQTAYSRLWPTDEQFRDGLLNESLYREIVRARLRTLLVGLENHLLSARSEPTTPHRSRTPALTIEHVMPVSWEKNWPLPPGAGEEFLELRRAAINSLGNLTLTTQSLNSDLSNSAWAKKRHTIQTHSLARLTTSSILTFPSGAKGWTQDEWTSSWDERRISIRGSWLADAAIRAWPRPAGGRTAQGSTDLSATTAPPPDMVREGTMTAATDSDAARASSGPAVAAGSRTRTVHQVQGDVYPLLARGLIEPGDRLQHVRRATGEQFQATVTQSGWLRTVRGEFPAPSTALSQLTGTNRNGWKDWKHSRTGMSLAELRDQLGTSSSNSLEDGENR